jgi:hypothetical protein
MHGVQLWIALPDIARRMAPTFQHMNNLPIVKFDGAEIRLLMGEFDGKSSPAQLFSPLIGAEILLSPGESVELPVRTDFEHGLLVLDGDDVKIDGELVPRGSLRYINTGFSRVQLESSKGARLLLIGGEPFKEEILMWWNFIGRSQEEIVAMRNAWQASLESGSAAFPDFKDAMGSRIPAPEMPNLRLEPRGSQRH